MLARAIAICTVAMALATGASSGAEARQDGETVLYFTADEQVTLYCWQSGQIVVAFTHIRGMSVQPAGRVTIYRGQYQRSPIGPERPFTVLAGNDMVCTIRE